MPALLAAGCRVVIDHFGRPDPALGIADPGFAYLLRQADSGQVWVKLAAPYRNWPAPDCARAGREAARLLLDAYTPDRLMWGSDWPHTEHRHLASYTAATQWLDAWIDDAAARQAVLADTHCGCFNSLEKHHDPLFKRVARRGACCWPPDCWPAAPARPRPPTPSARSRWWSPIRPAARSTSLPA